MSEFEASAEVIEQAALSCARNMEKLFGGVDEAIAALESDPVAMAQMLMADFIKTQKKLRLAVHMNPIPFCRMVLSEVQTAA